MYTDFDLTSETHHWHLVSPRPRLHFLINFPFQFFGAGREEIKSHHIAIASTTPNPALITYICTYIDGRDKLLSDQFLISLHTASEYGGSLGYEPDAG